MKKMLLYSIMPLDTEHITQICEDIHAQYRAGITTCPLFCMTLVPEDDPPVDKVSAFCAQYAQFKERLDAMGIPNGVLVQATVGHGWVLSRKFPFQQYTRLSDGEKIDIVCPFDAGFREYIYNVMRTIASYRPDHIMVDDDFVMLAHDGGGCVCPLHMQRFNALAGTSLSENELREELRSGNRALFAHFVKAQGESLLETAKIMRAGIDSIDPTLPGSYCCVGQNAEWAAEIADILKGVGNPVTVRINNGNYTAAGLRNFSHVSFRAAAPAAKLKDKVDYILAETDTCPQNRYSTSASFLHTHFTLSILEGLSGAKHWITRLSAFEPQSGVAYRKTLGKYSGFYQYLSDLVPTLSWKGCRMPVLKEPAWDIVLGWNNGEDTMSHWAYSVLERLGIPLFFSPENSGVLCLDGNHDQYFSDHDLISALSGPVFLASNTAKRLIERGFGKYIGVDVKPWVGQTPSYEKLYINNNTCDVQQQYQQLIPLYPGVKIHSMVCHSVGGIDPVELFPGVTEYENELGGRIFTFCGTPKANYNLVEAFSFLNYSRKRQLIDLLSKTDQLPVHYPHDEEVYLRVADMQDNQIFCGIFNIGFDIIEETELVCTDPIAQVQMLMPDGTLNAVGFRQDGNLCVVPVSAFPATPLILILTKA